MIHVIIRNTYVDGIKQLKCKPLAQCEFNINTIFFPDLSINTERTSHQ